MKSEKSQAKNATPSLPLLRINLETKKNQAAATYERMTAEEEAKQLDSVTDRVQEKELDASRANQALGALSTTSGESGAPSSSKTTAVKKEDVDVIVSELG